MNDNELLNLVEQELNLRQPNAFHLSVIRDAVRHDGNWRYIVVQPDRPNVRLSDYSRVLSAVEDAIEDDVEESVLLVPALPD